MKTMRSKVLSLTMIMVLLLMTFNLSFAAKGGSKPDKSDKSDKPDKSVERKVETEDVDEEDSEDVDEEDSEDTSLDEENPSEEDFDDTKKTKENKKIKEKAKDVEERLEDIEEALEGQELTDDQKSALKAMRDEAKAMRQEALEIRKEIREEIKNAYSQEELDEILQLTEQLREQYEGIKILPVDSIISNRAQFKFDLPPVIKEGRTLIPVRAITEGFGADVAWDPEEEKVTITKGEDEIVIVIGENVAYVNGVETVLDSKAEVINSRTVVPLRFVAETFGLDVEWNEEDETIEIDEDEDDVDEDNSDENNADEADTQDDTQN